jgi:hypothetical protein
MRLLAEAANAAATATSHGTMKKPNYTMSDLGWYDPFYSEDEFEKECELLDSFAIAMQTLLGILSFASLLLKRKWEIPKRSYRIFMLDISK